MKSKIPVLFIVLFVGASMASTAQNKESKVLDTAGITKQVLNLEQCIDYALKNNIQIKQSEVNTEIADINLVQSQGALLPAINGNMSHTYNFGRTIDRYTNQFAKQQVLSQNLGVSADFTLFNGLQTINTIHQNRYTYLASKYNVDKMKNDIALNVATAYLQILYNTEAVENARNQIGITTAQSERAKKLVEAGSVAKGSYLDIMAQLATEELNLTNAENQLNISYLALAQLMNLPSAQGLRVTKPEINIDGQPLLAATDANQIYTTALDVLPEIKSANYNMKSAEKGLDVAWGGLSPRLSLSAFYGTGYSGLSKRYKTFPELLGYSPNGDMTSTGETVLSPSISAPDQVIPFMTQYNDNINKSVGFYLTIPIFNRLQVKTSISRARMQMLSSELQMESTKLQIQKNVQQALADANAGLKKYYASTKAVEAIAESFKYTEQKFNVGIVNTNDYNDSKNKLIKAQSDLLQAKYEYIFKTKVLDFYQGKPLKL
ncbi:MAG TPA: TolC family protein [Bacteroidia bacterium]|nr:TolC family protein [Bacteroidia bacterium]